MHITVEQLGSILGDLRDRYRNSPYDLDQPEVLVELIRHDYPAIDGVSPPPSLASIWQNYVPPDWRAQVEIESQSSIGPDRGNGIRWYPGMPSPLETRYAEFREVARNPVGCIVFLVLISIGTNDREALRWGRVGNAVFDLLPVTRRGMLAHGDVRDGTLRAAALDHPRIQRVASRTPSAHPPGPPTPSPRLSATVSPRASAALRSRRPPHIMAPEIRARLERLYRYPAGARR